MTDEQASLGYIVDSTCDDFTAWSIHPPDADDAFAQLSG